MVVDCPDPTALAAFYTELIGLPVTGISVLTRFLDNSVLPVFGLPRTCANSGR